MYRMKLDLTDDQTAVLLTALDGIIQADRFLTLLIRHLRLSSKNNALINGYDAANPIF
jgi:hypothetical protein